MTCEYRFEASGMVLFPACCCWPTGTSARAADAPSMFLKISFTAMSAALILLAGRTTAPPGELETVIATADDAVFPCAQSVVRITIER
jgi:hypothetical protein